LTEEEIRIVEGGEKKQDGLCPLTKFLNSSAPHKWHICFCPTHDPLNLAKAKEPFNISVAKSCFISLQSGLS